MRIKTTICISALGTILLTTNASASTFSTQKFRCPVGGERFSATVQMSMTSFGQRPDGKGYDTGQAPMVECPGNGLVFYKDEFSKDEVAQLTPLVTGFDYQSLRKSETAEYRSAWLQKKMGAKAEDVAIALLVASWSSESDTSRKARYQQAFLDAAERVPASSEYAAILQLRAANALRELGRHVESDAMLVKLATTVGGLKDAEQRSNLDRKSAELRLLNREGNRSSDPVTMVPDEIAADICVLKDRTFSASEQARCASEPIRALIERFAKNRASGD